MAGYRISLVITGLIVLSAVLAGCVHPPAQPVQVPVREEIHIIRESENSLSELMHYYDSLQGMSKAALLKEYKYANSHYRESTDIQQRLKLLLLLTLPNTGFQTTQGALKLMETLPEQVEPSAPDTIAFKKLLVTLLKQQRAAKVQIENLTEKLHSSEAEIKTLKSKINAIKNIEKHLMRKNTL
ncbi:MAG: hypothetical protein IT527_08815 [Nitrosomonas sp.]|nr:hypothetical protein [Nitrosomonas sp.]